MNTSYVDSCACSKLNERDKAQSPDSFPGVIWERGCGFCYIRKVTMKFIGQPCKKRKSIIFTWNSSRVASTAAAISVMGSSQQGRERERESEQISCFLFLMWWNSIYISMNIKNILLQHTICMLGMNKSYFTKSHGEPSSSTASASETTVPTDNSSAVPVSASSCHRYPSRSQVPPDHYHYWLLTWVWLSPYFAMAEGVLCTLCLFMYYTSLV